MTKAQFDKWDRKNPPGLVSQFWIEHPKVAMWHMISWILEGTIVEIPYRWIPEGFYVPYKFPPKKPSAEEKYIDLTMFDHIDKCFHYINNTTNKKRWNERKGDEKYIKYPKHIADTKDDIIKIEQDIDKGCEIVHVIEKQVAMMKHKKVETAEAIDDMISMLLDSKRELAMLQQKKKEKTKRLIEQFEQILVSIEEKEAEITMRVLN